MSAGGGRRRTPAASAAALALFVGALFVYTVQARSPWFGKPADGHHFWLTAHTWKALENWWEEGALASRFAIYDNPRSVEHRSRAERGPYVSYPVGAFLPPFALARLTGTRPSPAFLMGYDLGNHLAIAALLAALAASMAWATTGDERLAALFGAVPAAIVLLAPGPMYWLQNVYFADQAVILPFVLALALEWARGGGGRAGRWAARLSPAVVLWGCLVDYLFVFVTLALFVARALAGEYGIRLAERPGRVARFWLAPAVALALFGLQLAAVGGIETLFHRARWRMGPADATDTTDPHPLLFWLPHARDQYGASGVALLAVGTILLLVLGLALRARKYRSSEPARRSARLLGIGALALAPCAAQLLALRNHSSIHDFSVLKLVVPLALVSFVVLPLAAIELCRRSRPEARAVRRASIAFALLAAAGSAVYLAAMHPSYRAQFPAPGVEGAPVAELLRAKSGYLDVVFSPQFEIGIMPPQLLAIARERVYRVSDPGDFARQANEETAGLTEPFRLCLLFTRTIPPPWRPLVKGIRPARGDGSRLFCGVEAAPFGAPDEPPR